MITKEEFEVYEKVRSSGKTNMLVISEVIRLSGGELTKEKIIEIIKDYKYLNEKYPGVRK